MKKPSIGQTIIHEEPAFSRKHEGKVVLLLSSQFVYRTDDNELRFCMYNEIWKADGKKTGSRNK